MLRVEYLAAMMRELLKMAASPIGAVRAPTVPGVPLGRLTPKAPVPVTPNLAKGAPGMVQRTNYTAVAARPAAVNHELTAGQKAMPLPVVQ